MQMHRRSAFVQRHRASMQHRCCPEGCAPHYPKRLFKPGMLRSPGHSEDLLYSSATSTSCAIPATRVTEVKLPPARAAAVEPYFSGSGLHGSCPVHRVGP